MVTSLKEIIDLPGEPVSVVLFSDLDLAIEKLKASIPLIAAEIADVERHLEQHTKTLKYLRRKHAAAGHYLHMFQQVKKR